MGLYPKDATETAYNGKDRNALKFGFTPQSEVWNGRWAMIGFVAYLFCDLNGYSIVRQLHNFLDSY
ncbi:chlorophyll a/b-binding protein [Nodularia sp. NIES-3585]|uniref:chlorophyll a/b-binding protein n=1 Tax=Nodularia sp. NIES-3585 TaxID=1973477 RepID=UPI000B5C784E|nr:chlorophyll a/b-binding protein [Nodularia sp. NIES-3585]GAX38685.1 CAB/ELIP/HLIP superfamily protein [Nodularia sp. NIES-3585]